MAVGTSLLQTVAVHQFMSFLARPTSVPMAMHNLAIYVIQSDMLNVYYSLPPLYCSFHLSFPALHQLQNLSQLQQSPISLQFPHPDVVIATDVMPKY